MKVSYLVTCSTETRTLKRLLDVLRYSALEDDEIVIIQDNTNPSEETTNIIKPFLAIPNIGLHVHPLNNDYGSHKNFGNRQCKGEWIFQIDGDECPNDGISGENIHAILDSNPEMELFYVPRLNDFKGVNESHATKWGWKLSYIPRPAPDAKVFGPLVNWPDYQGRIYRNIPERIKWDRRLHEKIEGHMKFASLPAEEEYALYHDKTIEKQIETNLRYNKLFTEQENKGHNVFGG